MDDETIDDSQMEVTLCTDRQGRWVKRVWGVQCPETIHFSDRCQGVRGHAGDHWCFGPDGSYHFKPHESDPRREHSGCRTTPPGQAEYRTPLEMSRHRYLGHYEDIQITDLDELARLERSGFSLDEGADRPCSDDEIRMLGPLESEDRRSRRERAAELSYCTGDFSAKSTTDDIAIRFDADVERFSNLETGQSATVDAPLSMQLITEAAVRLTPNVARVLDIGCGAGNNTLKLRQVYGGPFASDLLDLSGPMLERAKQRAEQAGVLEVTTWQADIRGAELPTESYDVVLAAAVLHHLRDDADWRSVFEKIFSLIRPGGSFWITDLVAQETNPVNELMWSRYSDYLDRLGGDENRQKVLDSIDREDSPRPVTYQLDLLRRVGFAHVELLHKNSCFAAFGAWKE